MTLTIDARKPAYKEAVKWFDIWGRVIKERIVSGDPSAVPSFKGEVNKGGDSSPSDPSALLMTFADVEMFLGQSASARQKVLAAYIHAFGVDEVMTSVVYVFPDGTKTEPMDLKSEKPVRAVDAEYATRRRTLYDLDAFPDADVDAFCRAFRWDKRLVLEREHKRLLVGLTRDKGLDPL